MIYIYTRIKRKFAYSKLGLHISYFGRDFQREDAPHHTGPRSRHKRVYGGPHIAVHEDKKHITLRPRRGYKDERDIFLRCPSETRESAYEREIRALRASKYRA